MKKPWAGRFQKETAKSVETFSESVSFDRRLWRVDIEGSIAHARMLAKQGIISRDEALTIIRGLKEIAEEIQRGSLHFDASLEDVHMNIEAALIRKTGAAGAKLHTARSRNDQVALDLRLYLRQEIREIIALIDRFQEVILGLARRHTNTLMPGYTHMQRAQPVVLAHHLLAYFEMFSRDRQRFEDALGRMSVSPLGACALAGTSLPIDRKYVAKLLRFGTVSDNSIDAISDRDFAIEFVSVSAMTMMHTSRLCEDLVLWSTEEFGFIELPDAFATGSSIMPQKKNPDVPELVRGKTGRVYGNLVGILTMMKALPLSYNRDMQEDKIPVFDTVDTVKSVLAVLADMLPHIKFNRRRMAEAASRGFSTATDVAEYLVSKGVPFRTAHEVVGRLVRFCGEGGLAIEDLPIAKLREFSPLFQKDLYRLLSARSSVARKRSAGGTSPVLVAKRIRTLGRARKP